MENKKVLIPVIIASILLLGIVFTLVYKKTSEDPFKEPEVQTLAPKETKQIETKVQTENGNNIEDFNINEALKNTETKVQTMLKEEDYISNFDENKESLGIINESDTLLDEDTSSEIIEEYTLSEEQEIAATSEVSEELNQGVEDGIREYTRKQAEQWYQEVLEANGGEIPWEE